MRNYLLVFGSTVSLVLGLTACLSLIFEPFEPLTGDLTRIGSYAEKDFGGFAPQTALDVAANGSFMADPDILVLGDSFSMGNLWQSVVTEKSGQKVQSFELGRDGCIRNWLAHALNHPSATTIIIETVERVLLPRFRDLPECSPEAPQPFEVGAWTTATTRHTWPPEWHIYRTLEVSLNTLEMRRRPASTIRSNMAVNAPIDSRCAKFSHRRPDRLLYYSQDEDKFQRRDSDLAQATANILQIQEAVRARGKQF
ncbi:MAG TPA: hypothetical protein VL051_12025, partial [Burkholderiaceae bacterium]|nr:hypothetical protein [Burkholderiaceae bacterium]